jgi:hypothetical protein
VSLVEAEIREFMKGGGVLGPRIQSFIPTFKTETGKAYL